MKMNKYLQQKASSWVTLTVLAGGVVVAGLLFIVVKIENEFQIASMSTEVQYEDF